MPGAGLVAGAEVVAERFDHVVGARRRRASRPPRAARPATRARRAPRPPPGRRRRVRRHREEVAEQLVGAVDQVDVHAAASLPRIRDEHLRVDERSVLARAMPDPGRVERRRERDWCGAPPMRATRAGSRGSGQPVGDADVLRGEREARDVRALEPVDARSGPPGSRARGSGAPPCRGCVRARPRRGRRGARAGSGAAARAHRRSRRGAATPRASAKAEARRLAARAGRREPQREPEAEQERERLTERARHYSALRRRCAGPRPSTEASSTSRRASWPSW